MRFLAFLTTLLIGLAVACSQQEGNKTDDSGTARVSDTSGAVAELDQRTKDSIEIDKVIKTGLTRWKYRDKAALYDNEFPYMRDEYTFDDYLELRRVQNAAADSLVGNQILSIQFFKSGDSAYVYQKLWWDGPSGRTHEMGSHERMYKYDGRWIHPMISSVDKQHEADVLNKWTDSLNQ
jgi:hypothetical protein